MRKMTAWASMLLLLFCTTAPQPAKAGGVFLGSTEITQLLNHVELIRKLHRPGESARDAVAAIPSATAERGYAAFAIVRPDSE